MKAMIVLFVLLTLGIIFVQYRRGRNSKKLLLSLFSFAVIVSLAVAGNLTRPVLPIFIAHLVLLVLAWGSLIWYSIRGRYYWWLIFSPMITIALFLLMEMLMGSGHEYLGEIT